MLGLEITPEKCRVVSDVFVTTAFQFICFSFPMSFQQVHLCSVTECEKQQAEEPPPVQSKAERLPFSAHRAESRSQCDVQNLQISCNEHIAFQRYLHPLKVQHNVVSENKQLRAQGQVRNTARQVFVMFNQQLFMVVCIFPGQNLMCILKPTAGTCGGAGHTGGKTLAITAKQAIVSSFFFTPSMENEYLIQACMITCQVCFSQCFGALFCFSSGYYFTSSPCQYSLHHRNPVRFTAFK